MNILRFSTSESFIFAGISIVIFGLIVAFLSWALYVISQLEYTSLDTSLFMYLVIALCVTALILFYSLFSLCWDCRFTRISLAIVFMIYDLAIGAMTVLIFLFEDRIIANVKKIWMMAETSGTIHYIQEKLNCCGYDSETTLQCSPGVQYCGTLLEDQFRKYKNIIGGSLAGFFVVILIGVIYAFYRACASPRLIKNDKSKKLTDFDDQNDADYSIF